MKPLATVLGITVGVLVIVLSIRKSPFDTNVKRSTSTSTSNADTQGHKTELETLRQRAEAAEAKAAKYEKELAELRKGAPAPTDDSPASPTEKSADWKKRRDAAFAAKVAAVPWKKLVKTLSEYFKEMDLAMKEGRQMKFNPAWIGDLTALNNSISTLAKELGLENVFHAYGNDLIHEQFTEAMINALAGKELTDEQLAKVRASKVLENDEHGDQDGPLLANWKGTIEYNLKMLNGTREFLTPEQLEHFNATLSPSYMSMSYSQTSLSGDTPEALVSSVTDTWTKKLGLPAGSGATVGAIASEFVRGYSDLVNQYAGRYGATLPKDRELELGMKLLDLQIAAEKRIADSVPVAEDQKKKLAAGSGTVIKLGTK